MKIKHNQYPTKWRWRFALFPIWFGKDTSIWLEWYQCQMTGPMSGKRRDLTGKTVEFQIYP